MLHYINNMSSSTTYSLEATVAAITSFYELVASLLSDEISQLQYPPPGGWPEINRNEFAILNLSDNALELLRHLPYFTDDSIQIMPKTAPNNYMDPQRRSDWSQQSRHLYGQPFSMTPNPTPDIVCLADMVEPERKDGLTILLDTRHGVVILEGAKEGFPYLEYFGGGDANVCNCPENSPEIRYRDFWKIDSFFRNCQRQFLVMNWMPMLEEPYSADLEVLSRDQRPSTEKEAMRMRILQEAGWPGDEYGRGWEKQIARMRMEEASEAGLL
jgi:hypothetical protein